MMINKKSMSHNVCYAYGKLSLLAVPKGFNLDRCRFRVSVNVYSDTTRGKVFFFEYHGMYWFALHLMPSMCRSIQSLSFVSMKNCITNFREQMRILRFTIETPELLRELLKIDSTECRNVAAESNRPTTTRRG